MVFSDADNEEAWRDRLYMVVDRFISDLKDSTVASVSMSYIEYNIKDKPETFVVLPPSAVSDQTDEPLAQGSQSQVLQEKNTRGLTHWFVGRMIHVFTQISEESELWQRTINVLSMLLQTVRAKDVNAFHDIAQDLILTLADLSMITESLYEAVSEEECVHDIRRFSGTVTAQHAGDGDTEAPILPIIINSAQVCENVQIALSKVLALVSLDLCVFANDCLKSAVNKQALLWATLGYQLEVGELDLKAVSLSLCSKLLQYGGLPEAQALDYYLDCFVALIQLIMSQAHQAQRPGEYESLEEALVSNIRALLQTAQCASVPTQDSNNVHSLLTTAIVACLTEHGSLSVGTEALRDCLFETITRLAAEQRMNAVIWDDDRKALNRNIVEQIGNVQHSQGVVTWLRTSILLDIESSSSLVVTDTSSSTITMDSSPSDLEQVTDDTGTARGDKMGTIPTMPDIISSGSVVSSQGSMDKWHTVICVRDKLERLCGSLLLNNSQTNQIDHVNVLSGIHCCLEVLAWILVKVDSSSGKETDVVSESTLSDLCKAWKKFIFSCCQHDEKQLFIDGYVHIVKAISCLVFAQDVLRVDDHFVTYTWILSINWLPNEMSWMDLKVRDHKAIVKMCSKIDDQTVPSGVLKECVLSLALLPKQIATKWRTHVITQALGDTRNDVKIAALQSFALFLFYMGPNSNHLIFSAIHPLLNDKSVDVLTCIANICGSLACVVSRKATVKRSVTAADPARTIQCITVSCASCCQHYSSEDMAGRRERRREVDAGMFVPFLHLIHAQHASIRLGLISSIKLLFGHFAIRAANSCAANALQSCLQLLHDVDYIVRVQFSKVCHHLLPVGAGDTSSSEGDELVFEMIQAKLKECLEVAKANESCSLMETLIFSVGTIGSHVDSRVMFSAMLIILLDSVCCPMSPLLAALVNAQLSALGKAKQLQMKHLYLRFGSNLSRIVVTHLHQQKDNVQSVVSEIVSAFQFESTQAYFKRTEQFLFPHLVMKATPTASQIIRFIAKQLGDPNHKGPLTRNIRYIFSHLLIATRNNEELEEKFHFLQDESGLSMDALVRCDGWPLMMGELMFSLADHKDKVINGFLMLCKLLGTTDIRQTPECIANLLQDRILAILVHFDNRLNNATISVTEKTKTYKSVISLMELMGSQHVTSVRHRIMTTLKIGLKYKGNDFPQLCCKAWDVYVRSIEMTSLGSMLAQITVSLIPLLTQLPQQVAQIFHYLIVQNQENFKDYLNELYFIPDIPELKKVNEVLNQYATVTHSAQSLKEQVARLLKGISHESQDVRQHALTKLKHLLHCNQTILHQFILASETVDPLVSHIISALLDGCRDSDAELRPLYGECLGEVGAVDPGRLESVAQATRDDSRKLQMGVTDAAFGFDFISCLAQAYLRAEDRTTQDCVAFAIQELIVVYDIKAEPDSSSPGSAMWKKFSEEIREILEPLMKSRYILTSQYNWQAIARPFYGTRKGSTYTQWLCTLTGYIGSRVTADQQAAKVFDACKGVIKNDSQVALYLLPHAVLHALQEENSSDVHDDLCAEILAVLNHVKDPDTRQSGSSDLGHMAAQTVFSVMADLQRCIRQRTSALSMRAAQEASARSRSHSSLMNEERYKDEPSIKRIRGFLERIPQETLALASHNCGAYTRALMHHEQVLKEHKEDVTAQEQLDFMQKLYVALDEPDGVTGITAIRHSQPTLNEQILAYESTGQLSDASVCYDNAIRMQPYDLSLRRGLLKCRLALGELNSAFEQANGILSEKPQWCENLNAFRVEAAWKLGQWDKLATCLKGETQTKNWNVRLGRILLAAKNKDEDECLKQIKLTRSELMGPLSAASMEIGSYQRAYEYIVRLHMLTELEHGVMSLVDARGHATAEAVYVQESQAVPLQALLQQWHKRLLYTQCSFRTQEPILNLRRTLLSLAKEERGVALDQEIGQCWLSTAKIARENGLVQTAHSSLLSASTFNLPEFCIEKAKWLWERGDVDSAQICLEKALEEHYPDRSKYLSNSDQEAISAERIACAEVLFLLVSYCDETSKLESNTIVRQYKEVTKVHDKWEDAHFQIGKYYDKIMTSLVNSGRPEKTGEFVNHVVQHFGQSLWYGSEHIYQSLPRMLSLWLDYGAEVTNTRSRDDVVITATKQLLHQLNIKMAQNLNKIATYQFLTALPQLVSRICHTHQEVSARLKELIAKCLSDFPQQTMWGMMAVSKSSFTMRVQRCQEIFNKAKSTNPDLSKFLQDATKLTDRLLDLCNRPCDKSVSSLSMSQHFKPLQRLIDDRRFSAIMLPLQSLMTVTLPSSGKPADHVPFPWQPVFIKGIEDTVELLASLQRPKKVTMKGSDGKWYIMLCKPKDDLRKDARLMEFNGIVNKFFRKDPEARRRNLLIKTFTVTPLNEECGMLEWVQNTCGLRQILMKLYKEKGLYTSGKELSKMQLPSKAPLQKKLEVFRNELLPKHPDIFSEWFLKTFPDPTSWYNARLAYCRTLAVMSMTGYILGLGDRHGENILMDSTNGYCVHVDFNCLFNKGETFDYPEVVPFRLTHNLVDAMGPMGYEGVFRRACEVCLRVMRNQSDPLMSVLKSFIYDPLVEWSKPTRGRTNQLDSGEIKNEMAQTHVSNIDSRLQGLLKSKSKPRGLALSVEGHVNHLIKEATDENNLCQMYVGWAPYL